MKFLLWLVLGIVVFYVLRKKARAALKAAEQRPAPPGRPAPASQTEAEAMVSCALCGVYLPESEALRNSADKVFCCEQHRHQYDKR